MSDQVFFRCFEGDTAGSSWRWWCSRDPNDVFRVLTHEVAVVHAYAAELLGFRVYGDEEDDEQDGDRVVRSRSRLFDNTTAEIWRTVNALPQGDA